MAGKQAGMSEFPPAIDKPFSLIAFDWDGTAVPNRQADAEAVTRLITELLTIPVTICIITGTNAPNIQKQINPHLVLPNNAPLYLLTNRGSEVYSVSSEGHWQVEDIREATPMENRQLDEAAQRLVTMLEAATEHQLPFEIIYNRMNRRKIDLIPTEEWADPPKAQIEQLLIATETRLVQAGLAGGIARAVEMAQQASVEAGLADAKLTSDVKHIEIGLTDKADSARWIMHHLAYPQRMTPDEIAFGGDEFGPIGGFTGSDSLMLTPETAGCVFFSVGPEPHGVPDGVIHLGGGPTKFRRVLSRQLALQQATNPTQPALSRRRTTR
jgi:hydroxymethylpyrimidine pyrophosphatase-like HAD family hydrolase